MPVGSLLAFAGHQLHATVPNTANVTRFSIDFRTVHQSDLEVGEGAPKSDDHCTGTTLRDFRRTTDLASLDADLIARDHDTSSLEYADTLVFRVPVTTEIGGRVALVTGASQGIGLAMSARLAEAQMRVWMVARASGRSRSGGPRHGRRCPGVRRGDHRPGGPRRTGRSHIVPPAMVSMCLVNMPV